MKTAVLMKTNLLNGPADNVSLNERHNIKFHKFQVNREIRNFAISENNKQEYNIKCSIFNNILNIYNFSVYVNNSLLSSIISRVLSLISFLHSLRYYFKKKINIYFCDKCSTYFKEVILLEKLLVCSKCVNSISYYHLQISEAFNLLYSNFYPLEPKACIMGCLCKWKVLQKRPYILCGCIHSHNHIDHNKILKNIIKSETKLWNKISHFSYLKCTPRENVLNLFKNMNDSRNFKILPFQKVILTSDLRSLQIEFYKSCNSLYELFITNYNLNGDKNEVKHLKRFIHACSSKNFIFPNFQYMFKDFVLFYNRALCVSSQRDQCLKVIVKKLFFCTDYSELMLLFGFYVYCFKVLKFCQEKSVTMSKFLLKFVDRWQKRHMLKVFFRICYLYNQSTQTKKKFTFKNEVCTTVHFTEFHTRSNEYPFPNSKEIIINSGNNSSLEKRDDENLTIVENLGDTFTKDKKLDSSEMFPVITNSSHNLEISIDAKNCLRKNIHLDSLKQVCTENVLSVTNGKEELDVIDGVNIYSFETEEDMTEYTELQSKHLGMEDISHNEKITNSGRIIPTKTHDITKIKGWRNKFFCINRNENHVSYPESLANYCERDSANIKIKEESTEINPQIKEEHIETNPQIKEEPVEYDTKVEVEKQSNIIEVKKEKLEFDDVKFKEEFIQSLEGLYLNVLSEDPFFKKLSDEVKNDEPRGIFQSTILDDYLQNHTGLKISFKLPETHVLLSSLYKDNSSVLPAEIKKSDSQRLKDEQIKEKVKKLSSTDFIQNMQGDITNRKFIWVQGRPIMIEHEIKKTSVSNSSKKRLANNSSVTLEEKMNLDKEENNLKKMKIKKQLEYNDGLLSENECFEFPTAKPACELESKPRKPYLSLLNTFKIDEIDEECIIHPEKSSKQKFPLIFPCTSVSNGHSECTKFKQIQLVMVINVGYKRPFLKEVTNNMEKLKKDLTTIDSMWAHIAASAVCRNKSIRTVKRYIVPVVSDSLIEVVKFNIENVSSNIAKLNELNVDSVYRSICASQTLGEVIDVEHEIKDVVNDIIEYVVKKDQYELLTIPYDPDVPNPLSVVKRPIKKAKKSKVERELKRLINVSLIDDWHETDKNFTSKDSCSNEYCLKGCICNSLNSRLRVLHCGKLECMFECSCDTKTNYSFSSCMQRGRSGTLARDESNWHQTVICKNNEVIEVKAGAGKSKREKKLPTRYRNNVLLGKEMNCLDLYPLSPEYSKKSNLCKLPSPNKDKDIRSKDKDGKMKDKEIKMKFKDKEAKIREDKEAKIIEKDKETKTVEKDKESKIIEKDEEAKIIEKGKEIKIIEKDKVAKIIQKDKEAKIIEKDNKEANTIEKYEEPKIIEKHKEFKIIGPDKGATKLKEIDTGVVRFENDKEGNMKGKCMDVKPKEKQNCKVNMGEKFDELHGRKVILPLKNTIKKENSKHKAMITANLNQILNPFDFKKMEKICHEETNPSLTLADVFVWCSIHCRYSCPCSAQIFILKNNRLVWKPTAKSAHLTSKHMSRIVINRSMPKHHVFDQECHSARTIGSIFNYKLRNCNPVFKSKRLNEIVNNVLSNTNSFIKIHFASVKNGSPKLEVQKTEEIETKKPTVKIIKNGIVLYNNKQKPTLEVNHNDPSELKKRKRSSIELENNTLGDKMKPTTYIIANNKDELILQNAKKRYRIGPAHFDCMGSYRTIESNFPQKSITKPNVDDHTIVDLTAHELRTSFSVEDHESKVFPKYGLLCLTQGFGYLPIKEFTQKKLQVQDPLSETVFHCFKDIESANKWLNRFFKNRIIFESLNVNLRWVIVKPGILKHSQPFDKSLLENPTKIVNKDGYLVDVTSINGSIQHRMVAASSSEIPLSDEDTKTKILGIKNEAKQDICEVPLKKAKISGTLKEEKNAPVQRSIINLKLIKKPTGFLSSVNYESCPTKTTLIPSTNVSNHSSFFRLNNSQNSSVSEGCFIPLVPSCTSKEFNQLHNVDRIKCKDSEPESVTNILSSKSCNSLYNTDSKTNSQEKLIVSRISKAVPVGIKTLRGKSILKTKFK